jgi:hypothetical protein
MCRGIQSQEGARKSIDEEQSIGVDNWAKMSFGHHPRIKKQGIRIYRLLCTEVMTIDSAPGRLLRHGLTNWG